MRRAAARSLIAVPLALALLASCDRSVAGPEVTGPLSVQIVSGDAQRGVVGRELPQPIIVKVTDERGKAVKDQLVNFVVVSGGGSVFAGSAITDKQGVAREFWTLGMSLAAGANVLEVRAVDENGQKRVYARFTATGIPVPIGSIVLNRTSATIEEGEPLQLTATLYDDIGNILDPAGRTVEWLSSNSGIVASQGGGNFEGVKAGGPIAVTALAEGKKGAAMITVVEAAVAYIEIYPQVVRLEVGSLMEFQASAYGTRGQSIQGRTFTWTTSNASVAELVSSSGDRAQVRTLALGNAEIRATLSGAFGGALVIVVPPPIASIEVAPNPVSLLVGSSVDLTATVRDTKGDVVTGCDVWWYNPSAALQLVETGPNTARITGLVAAPSASVMAGCDNFTANVSVTVTRLAVGSIALTPALTNLQIGQTQLLTTVVRDVNGTVVTDRAVQWTTSDMAFVTLALLNGPTNTATARGTGTATITVTSEGVSQTATIVVAPVAVASVEVQGVNAFGIGETFYFGAVLKDANGNILTGRSVTWSLSNESPAGLATLVVAANGNAGVTGLIDGTLRVVATSEGVTGSRPVTINPLNDPLDNESPTSATFIGTLSPGMTTSTSSIFGRNADQSDWYRVTAIDGNTCTSGTKTHNLHLTLSNIPLGRNYDVFVYDLPGGPVIASGTNPGNVAESFDVSKSGACGTSLTFSAYIEVRRTSGTPSSSPYSLGMSVP